jgi:hypothetical protein
MHVVPSEIVGIIHSSSSENSLLSVATGQLAVLRDQTPRYPFERYLAMADGGPARSEINLDRPRTYPVGRASRGNVYQRYDLFLCGDGGLGCDVGSACDGSREGEGLQVMPVVWCWI